MSAPTPPDLEDRRVEITGPAERKMMINALNSGARVFMADLEDALSPGWSNVIAAQTNLRDAVRRELALETPEKSYSLNEETATLVVRPRGWHLVERHVLVDGRPISASLFDAGLYLFHNAREALDRDSGPCLGPYFYLPKLEGRYEARLWNEVFVAAQERLGIPRGTIRATVLVETILAAFEMDEILRELREHAAGLNAGRWDYIFSLVKRFRSRSDMVLPDRAQVTMAVPFMRSYARLLVSTCHRRGAHAMGGMSALSRTGGAPTSRRWHWPRYARTRSASRVTVSMTWVAHPDLVPVAREVFDRVLGDAPHQKDRRADDVSVEASDLLDVAVPDGRVTEAGVRTNVSVALQYLDAWLGGNGAGGHQRPDGGCRDRDQPLAALAVCRHGVALEDGRTIDHDLYRRVRDEELAKLGSGGGHVRQAAAILDDLVLAEEFPEFLTLLAYSHLD